MAAVDLSDKKELHINPREFNKNELIDLGIKSTKQIVSRGEAFLNGELDQLEEEEKQTQEESTSTSSSKAQPGSTTQKPATTVKQKEIKIIEAPNRELSEQDAIALLNNEVADETEEDDDDDKVVDKNKKLPTETKDKTEEQEDAIVINKKPEKGTTQGGTATETTTGDNDDVNIYSEIAVEMANLGIFESEQQEDGTLAAPAVETPQELLELFQASAGRMASETLDNFLNGRGEEAREIFDAIINRGVPPKEYITKYAQVQDFKTIDLTNEDNQERIVREFYRQTDLPAESIDRKIKQFKDNNELAAEAEDAQKVLIAREQKGLNALVKQKEIDDKENARVKYEWNSNALKVLNDKARIQNFDGIPLTPELARKAYKDLTEERYRLDDQLLTEFDKQILDLRKPENHALKVKLYLLLETIKADPTLSKISKKAVSNESSQAFQGLRKRNSKAGATTVTKTAKTGEKQEVEAEPEITSWFNKK